MKIIIFGASGMVGQGVLKECLLADDVKEVTVVGRKNLDIQNSKLKQVITADLHQTDYLNNNQNFDACFFVWVSLHRDYQSNNIIRLPMI